MDDVMAVVFKARMAPGGWIEFTVGAFCPGDDETVFPRLFRLRPERALDGVGEAVLAEVRKVGRGRRLFARRFTLRLYLETMPAAFAVRLANEVDAALRAAARVSWESDEP